ncbi:unnamed protein product [Symbiodinium sp. CCMP2592]|nr:unnamed protein product [Symbiodinium sp. CCMP2592]
MMWFMGFGQGKGFGRRRDPWIEPEMKIWIGNLPVDATWKDLQTLGNTAGATRWVEVFRGKGSKGTGMIAYKSAEEVAAAVQSLQGKMINGQAIQVDSWQKAPPAPHAVELQRQEQLLAAELAKRESDETCAACMARLAALESEVPELRGKLAELEVAEATATGQRRKSLSNTTIATGGGRAASTGSVSFGGGSSSSAASHLAGSDPAWGVGAGSGSGQSGASGGAPASAGWGLGTGAFAGSGLSGAFGSRASSGSGLFGGGSSSSTSSPFESGHLLTERKALAKEERKAQARALVQEAVWGRHMQRLREAIADGEKASLQQEELAIARQVLAEEERKARAKTRFHEDTQAEPVSFLTLLQKEIASRTSRRGRSRSPCWNLRKRIGRSVMPRTTPLLYVELACWEEDERGRCEDYDSDSDSMEDWK